DRRGDRAVPREPGLLRRHVRVRVHAHRRRARGDHGGRRLRSHARHGGGRCLSRSSSPCSGAARRSRSSSARRARSTARAARGDLMAALPNALDLLALAADAGLGFDAAVAQVVARLEGPLAVVLRRVLVELRIGRDRRLVLREFARRTALVETARVANAIVQADALGLPLARTFRELAQEMRVRRRQRAEEQARTAPIKMLFPMVLLIFPALFIVILGPAVPQIMEALNVGP